MVEKVRALGPLRLPRAAGRPEIFAEEVTA
jgi:hypothetical protein